MMEGSGENGDCGPTAMRKWVLLTSRELRRGPKAQLRSAASASARIWPCDILNKTWPHHRPLLQTCELSGHCGKLVGLWGPVRQQWMTSTHLQLWSGVAWAEIAGMIAFRSQHLHSPPPSTACTSPMCPAGRDLPKPRTHLLWSDVSRWILKKSSCWPSRGSCRQVLKSHNMQNKPACSQVKVKVAQLYPTLCDPVEFSPGQNTGMGSLSLLQGILPTRGSNPGLPHCRRILYLSHQP